MDFSVNYLAVAVAALAAFAFGFLVHGPLFGKQWMKLMKITRADMEKGMKEMAGKMPLYMLGALIQQVITAYVVALFVNVSSASDVVSALILAFLLWLGFIATTLLNGVLWEKRSIPLYSFNIAYQLGSMVIITLIVTLWQ